MPALFEQGFFVRVPAWHQLGVVLDDYPGREEAMRLAGHDWDIIEVAAKSVITSDVVQGASRAPALNVGPTGGLLRTENGYKFHLRSDTLATLHCSRDSFERIPNAVGYDFAEAVIDQGFRFEAGVTLDGGALCALTLILDEPVTITGDTSEALPYLGIAWAHDGTASLRANYTTVRRVCANTVAASEAEGRKNGAFVSIRHTKNWRDRVEDAKLVLKGIRAETSAYVEAMEELAALPVSGEQRDLFVSTIIGDRVVNPRNGDVKWTSMSADTSVRVKNNIERERVKVLSLFGGSTIPEAHSLTGYGLHLAGSEYFDHLRNFRSQDSYVKRTLLTHSREKANLRETILEVVAA